MKKWTKLPLYLGLFVLVVSVLVSAIKLGESNSAMQERAKASTSGSSLSLTYANPGTVSVAFAADRPIAGIDVAIKYDKEKISIIPSSLVPGKSFITSGGIVDEVNSTFSFSALANSENITSGIVANFDIKPLKTGNTITSSLQFIETENSQVKTTILDRATASNILSRTEGITFTLSDK